MSKVLTAKEICERALRAIGSFPITESAADGEALREAMSWLDLIMAQYAGSTRLFNLIPATVEFPIINGTSTYSLTTALGANLPPDRVQFAVGAYLEDSNGNRSTLEIVPLDKFENVYQVDKTGIPSMMYIDRLADAPKVRIWPTPASGETTEYKVKLNVQTYAPNVAPGGVTGSQPSASVLTKFRQAWQRWLILRLCIDLASGPITKLPKASLDNWKEEAREARQDLEAFENREHETTPPICEPWGF